jgi:hypothetical protein
MTPAEIPVSNNFLNQVCPFIQLWTGKLPKLRQKWQLYCLMVETVVKIQMLYRLTPNSFLRKTILHLNVPTKYKWYQSIEQGYIRYRIKRITYFWHWRHCIWPNVFAYWKNVYVVEQNNSISRALLEMKTNDWRDYRFETYVNTDGWK